MVRRPSLRWRWPATTESKNPGGRPVRRLLRLVWGLRIVRNPPIARHRRLVCAQHARLSRLGDRNLQRISPARIRPRENTGPRGSRGTEEKPSSGASPERAENRAAEGGGSRHGYGHVSIG